MVETDIDVAVPFGLSCVTLLLSAQHLMDGGGDVSLLPGVALLCLVSPYLCSGCLPRGTSRHTHTPASPHLGSIHPFCPPAPLSPGAVTLLKAVSFLCPGIQPILPRGQHSACVSRV